MAAKRPKKTVPKIKNPPQGPNPWDVAPILDQGDPNPEMLWTAVGRALTGWEKLDQVQAHIFGILCGSRLGAASTAYGTIVASSTRASMVLAAAEVVLKDAPLLSATTIKMLGDIGNLGSRRNEIAHGIVSHYKSSEPDPDRPGGLREKDNGHFLMPPSYAVKYRTKKALAWNAPFTHRGKYAYTAAQVDEYGGQFANYYVRLVPLMFTIQEWCDKTWPPPKPAPPDAPPLV